MYSKIFLLSFVILSYGCWEKSKYSLKNRKLVIYPDHLKVVRAENMKWRVGTKLSNTVSRGLRVKLKLPTVDNELVQHAYSKGADSWLVQVQRMNFGRKRILGHLYVSFISRSRGGGAKILSSDVKNVFLHINYSAASRSKRLDNLKCPALKHRKLLTKFTIKKSYAVAKHFFVRKKDKLRGRARKTSLEPLVFDGGNSMVGQFYFSLALYNAQTRTMYSDFLEFSNHLDIIQEEDQAVKGCEDFKSVTPYRKENNNKKFKWKH